MALTWTNLAPATTPPDSDNGKMLFDVARNRLWMYLMDATPVGPPFYFDELDYWNGTDWTRLARTSTPSVDLIEAAIAYDDTNGEIALFGGRDSGGYQAETWTTPDGVTWTQRALVTHPSAVAWASFAYSPTAGYGVLFGGYTGAVYKDETWRWDSATRTWTQLFPVDAPSARYQAAFAFDPTTENFVLYGGWDGAQKYDTWIYDTVALNWVEQFPSTAPASGGNPYYQIYGNLSTRYKPLLAKIESPVSQGITLWEWDDDLGDWTQITTTNSPTVGADGGISCLNITTNQLIYFDFFNQTTWSLISLPEPPLVVAPTYQRVYGLEIQLTNDGVEGPVTVRTSAQSQQA